MPGGMSAWTRLAAVSVVVVFLSFGAYQIYDYDIPLHLITGEYLLQDLGSADKNLFSFTNPDYPWLNDKWLENVLVHVMDAAAGPSGLVMLRMALLLAMGTAIWMAMRNRPGRSGVRLAILSLVPWVAYERFNLRPELFSLILIPVMVWFVSRRSPSSRDWIFVAALHALWVNLHGYWIVGPLVLIAFLAGDLVELWTGRNGWPPGANPEAARSRLKGRSLLLLAAFGGAWVSPSPLQMFLNPFRVLGFLGKKHDAMGTIAELRSPFDPLSVFNWALPFFAVAALAVLACLLWNVVRAHPAHWFLFLGFFLMALRNRRNIGMFAVVGAIVGAWSLGAALNARLREPPVRARWAAALPLLLVLGNAMAAWFVLTDRFYIADVTSRRTGPAMSRLTYPVGLADFLRRTHPPLRFFNDFVSGNYLAYRLYPDYRVYIAGNTFKYPNEFFDNYALITLGGDEYKRAAQRYDLNAFAIQYRAADMMGVAQRLFNDADWAPVYFDDNALLFVRDVPELAPFISAHRVNFAQLSRQRASEIANRVPTTGLAALLRPAPYPRGAMNRGTFLQRVGHFDLAEMEYRRALQARSMRDVRHALADAIQEMGRFQEAAEIYDELLGQRPGFWDGVRLAFDGLRGARRLSDEPHILRDLFHARSGIGSNVAAQKDWQRARIELETALQALERVQRMDPGGDPMRALEATTRFNLGTTLLRLSQAGGGDAGLEARADSLLGAAEELQPDDAGLLYRLARTRARQGRDEEAFDLLARAIATGGPDYLEAARTDPAMDTLRSQPRFRALAP